MAPNFWTFQRVLLDNEVQSSDSAPKIVKLPLSNYIHTLYVKAKITNGVTSCKGLSMQDVIDKIEIVANGSDVLVSLTPQELKRWAAFFTGLNIPQNRTEIAGEVQEATYPIFFGRQVFDPNFFLPAARLADLELRVTYSPTIAATAFVTGTFTLSVFALMSMGAAPGDYLGTLTHKTVSTFTSAASGDNQTLIPRGNLLRSLMVYAYEAAIEDGVDVTRVKFDLNNSERVMFDLPWKDLQDMNAVDYWVDYQERIRAFIADTNTLATLVSRIRMLNTSEFEASSIANDTFVLRRGVSIAGDTVTFESATADVTAGAESYVTDATGGPVFVEVEGQGIPHAVFLDFSKAGESAILNTNEYDQVRLTLTQGGAGADVRISTQEVRSL